MPQQYTNGFDFQLTSGTDTCVELPAPPRGVLRRFTVKQISGTLEGFTFNLLDRKDACAAIAEISGDAEPGAPPEQANKLLDRELHRLLPEVTVTSGNALDEQYNLQMGYQNRDEQDVRRTPESRIYLDIRAAGSGVKDFQVAYTIEPVEMT